MNIDHLVKMANEISAFFVGASTPEQAPRDVATHIRRYWEPRMRQAMLAHFAQGGAGLTDLARSGVALLASEAAAGGGRPGAASGTPAAAPDGRAGRDRGAEAHPRRE